LWQLLQISLDITKLRKFDTWHLFECIFKAFIGILKNVYKKFKDWGFSVDIKLKFARAFFSWQGKLH
jgi:hypothetical protein